MGTLIVQIKITMENKTTKWYDNKSTVILLCIFFFPVGLYGLWQNQSISKGWKIAVTAFYALIVLSMFSGKPASNSTAKSNPTTSIPTETPTPVKRLGIDDVVHTKYFDITVNEAKTRDRVSTGNQFSDLQAENGNMYLIINTTFKNTDNESRMIFEGSVWINYNGKDYEFDKSEPIMADGWGLFLEQLNPLTSKTTNLVYKIPTEIKGDIYWQPGRSDEKIFIGNIPNQ